MRWYPRVQEITAKTHERALRLACESKSVQKIIPLRRRVFPVADDLDYAAPRGLIRIFLGLQEIARFLRLVRVLSPFLIWSV